MLGAVSVGLATPKNVSLMYVPIVLNGRKIPTMVDRGATHSIMSMVMVRELGMKFEAHTSR